jgi:hypothetical protein
MDNARFLKIQPMQCFADANSCTLRTASLTAGLDIVFFVPLHR